MRLVSEKLIFWGIHAFLAHISKASTFEFWCVRNMDLINRQLNNFVIMGKREILGLKDHLRVLILIPVLPGQSE